ncbi:MAG: hypothetical protein ACM3KR_03630 [Deltaproteobacteria bacterium]
MKRTLSLLMLVLILISAVFSPASFAEKKIKLFKTQESMDSIVKNNVGALMLKQDWYGMKFEINQSKQIGLRKLSTVDMKEYALALSEINYGAKDNSVNQSVYGNIYSAVTANVYFLDYKLKDYSNAMALSFKDNSIVVFGTSVKLGKEEIHRLAVHELGHQVDFQLMDEKKRQEYRKIRGIEDSAIYNDSSKTYVNRPQEIFAEDFRLLFGGEVARKAPHLNSSLEDVNQTAQLKEFFLSLISQIK